MIAPAEAREEPHKVWLKSLPDEAGGSTCMAPEQSQLLIGRHPACELQVNSACVSSHHALLRRGARFEVEVLSSNGMLVAGRWRSRGDRVEIQSGDRLALCCFQKTQQRQQPPLLVWELSAGPECAVAREGEHNEEAQLLPLCERSTRLSPCTKFGPPPNFMAGYNDSSDATACVKAMDGIFILQQRSDAGCFVNEFWVGPGKEEILRHGDVITFCRTRQKFLPNTRGCYMFISGAHTKKEVPTPCRLHAAGKLSPRRAFAAGPDSLTMTVQETVLGAPPSMLPRCNSMADPSQTLQMPGAWWTKALDQAAEAASLEEQQQDPTYTVLVNN